MKPTDAAKPNKSPHPPKWLDTLLAWFCAPHLLEEIMGDLHERYYLRMQRLDERSARKQYFYEVLAYMRPSVFKRKTNTANPHYLYMFGNYFTIALRNLSRSKAFSFINILGLALGMACSLLIYLWVQDEQNVDNFHANGKQLFRVYVRSYFDGNVNPGYNTPALLPAELKRGIPEIAYASGFVKYFRLSLQGDIYETFQVGDKIHKLKGGRAGEDFFKMFSYPLLQGTPETALKDPSSLAISRKMAQLYFGSPEEAVGKMMRFDGRKEVMVSAVFENPPASSSDQFDYLLNWDAWVAESPFKQSWGHFGTLTYIQLREDANPQEVESKMKKFLHTYLKDLPSNIRFELGLQPFGGQYLYSTFENGLPSGGRIEYVRLFSGVAVFILLIACINFMNLATASSIKRAKEVGIRKVVGAAKGILIGQFIGEALLLVFLAALVSLLLAMLTLPVFNNLTGKQMHLPFLEPSFILTLVALVVITGFMAGSYPALFMSSLQPVKVLKGAFRFGSGATWLRKGLVVFQFMLSIMLLIATLVISRQTDYVQTKNLGYNRENILYIPIEGNFINKYLTFKQEASNMPGIKLVDRSAQFPHTMEFLAPAVEWEGKDPNSIVPFATNSVGYDFVKLMGLKIIQGRDFSKEFGTDSTNFIVNEEAVRRMGLKDPIGKLVSVWGVKKGKIVGVLKDYHFQSLHQSIQPVILDIKENLDFGTILVRTEPGKTQEALNSLEKVCKQVNPNHAYGFSFMDEQYGKLYKSEQVITTLSHAFAGMAIVISCLGLLGLAMFSAEQRTKEISIRKVLGASPGVIVAMFSREFLQLVSISFVIAAPVAWFVMHKWLQGFAYQIDLSWWIFALAGASTLLVTLFTVSVQAIKAAVTNPVKTLRTE